MVVEVADNPFILACELEIRLPEAVGVLPLEPTPTPDSSGVGDGVVQSGLVEDLVDGCMPDWLLSVVAEIAFYAAWSPMPCSSQLEDEFCRGL